MWQNRIGMAAALAQPKPDIHRTVLPRRTADQIHKLVKEINARIADKSEDIIRIGVLLHKAFGEKLPKSKWNDWGVRLPYREAYELRELAQHPWMADPENLKHFPAKRSLMIDLWRLLKHLTKIGKPELFLQRIKDGTINSSMYRGRIRDLITLDGMTAEQRRTEFRKAALADPAYYDGSSIHTGDYTILYDILKKKPVDMLFTAPPWEKESVHLYGGLAKLAAATLTPGGWCLAYCGQDSLAEVIKLMSEHLEYYWTFAVRYGHRKPRRQHVNIGSQWNPILVFRKLPFIKHRIVVDIVDGEQDGKDFHEWGEGIKEAKYYIEQLTDSNSLVVDPFAGGGTIPTACKLLGRRCIATEKDPEFAAAIRKRLADTVVDPSPSTGQS
jgi:hypothetical protein